MPAEITVTHPRLEAHEENKLNDVGDRLANMLGLRIVRVKDTQGRIRWATNHGDKTGIGLLRTIESFIATEIAALERKA